MRHKALLLAIGFLLCANGLPAQELAPTKKTLSSEAIMQGRISLDFKNIDIVEALKFLSTKAGLNIIPTRSVSGRLTLMVEDALLDDVFHIMLRSNGLAYDKRGDIYNVMTEQEYLDLYGKGFSDLRKFKVFHLKYALPDQAFSLCETLKSEIGIILLNPESGSILVLDTPEKLEEIEEALNSLENKNTIIKVFDLKYAQSREIVQQLKDQLDVKKVGSIKADSRTNQVIVQTLEKRMGDIENLIEQLDQKTREVLVEVRIIKISMSDSLDKGIEWEGLFEAARRYGLTYVGSYPFSAVQASTDPWRSRKTVLDGGMSPDGSDRINPVGYVGAYPFSGTITDSSNYAAGKRTVGIGTMHLGMVGRNDFDVIFRYLRTIGDLKVVASPKIAVINNQEARVHIGEKQAYITNTTTQTSSTTTVAEEVTFVDIGIQLFLTPTINDEGYVTIKLKPEISSISSFLETSEGNKIPIINTSTTETTVMIKDSSTIMIGGLKEESETGDTEEVPFFSKIPLLGNLFSSSTKTKRRSELLVMVTPHIISGDELTTGYARDLGYRLDKENQFYPDFAEGKMIETFRPYREYSELRQEDLDPKEDRWYVPPPLKPMKKIEESR
jgi:type II secretory pathway component GspD/PulD (secretin)